MAAQGRDSALEAELPAVRSLAAAWRNGLGALLAGVVGFGLVKGRSDISALAFPWNIVSGVLLLSSLVCGGVAAFFLLRSATGMPGLQNAREVRPGLAWAHVEALTSLRALRRGIRYFFSCVVFLVMAVGVTWYGPASAGQQLMVITPGSTLCGSVVRLSNAVLTLKTAAGEVSIDLRQAMAIRIVDIC